RHWLDENLGKRPPEFSPRGDSNVIAQAPAPPLDLALFARTVLAAARDCQSGRYGDNKVFVVHVWRALLHDPDFQGIDLATFKARLAEANNARLLNLSRADLVQAMDRQDVQLSEVT